MSGISDRTSGNSAAIEFVVALPGMGMDATAEVGEEIRSAIAAHAFVKQDVVLRPGISIGVAAFPQSATDALSL
jgi:GGDEF domain-containing protein